MMIYMFIGLMSVVFIVLTIQCFVVCSRERRSERSQVGKRALYVAGGWLASCLIAVGPMMTSWGQAQSAVRVYVIILLLVSLMMALSFLAKRVGVGIVSSLLYIYLTFAGNKAVQVGTQVTEWVVTMTYTFAGIACIFIVGIDLIALLINSMWEDRKARLDEDIMDEEAVS